MLRRVSLCRPALARALSAPAAPVGVLYTAPGTPSPDTVHMFLHEAAANDWVAIEKVNIMKKSNRSDEFLEKNPMGEVPALVLADGSGCITESLVICKYIDSVRMGGTGSSLTGQSAAELAEMEMWAARVETKLLTPLFWSTRCGPLAKFFADRTPGYIHPEVSEPMGIAAKAGYSWLDAQLAGKDYLCGSRFTLADIRLYVNYQFLSGVHKKMVTSEAEHPNFVQYLARVAARDSAQAIQKPKK